MSRETNKNMRLHFARIIKEDKYRQNIHAQWYSWPHLMATNEQQTRDI